MGTLTQTVLPFKVGMTEEMLTANAVLALFDEFMQGLGLHRWLAQEICPCPAAGAGLAGLDRANRRTVAAKIRQTGATAHTLDCDASHRRRKAIRAIHLQGRAGLYTHDRPSGRGRSRDP